MVKTRFSYPLLIEVGCYLLPALALLSIWIPLIRHYYVPSITITHEMLNGARMAPSDQLLKKLQEFYFFDRTPTNEPQLVDTARKLLKGEMETLGYPGEKIGMPFDANDIDRLSVSWQLLLAKFTVPRLLLAAYQASRNEEFIAMARDVILQWALYERRAWLPRGFLWHDTTVAERVLVLAEFWRLYRHYRGYDPEVAKTILGLASRSAQVLAKPTHYTVASNHGIIQNLALWHFCLAFPTLPNVEQYKHLTFVRMRDHLAFYINDEGVILEHSAGYQKLGLQFIGMALRYLSLLHLPIPEEWSQKYERVKDFYAHLRHPDGSLPAFGDTSGHPDISGPPVVTTNGQGPAEDWQYEAPWSPRQANSLYPVAGYSIWWDGLELWPRAERLAQTVVVWSRFPGHAHKHADEMSVLLWAGGQTWWTNVGYWPYDAPGRSGATSWDGSSAPHLLSEDASSVRKTRLRSYGWSDHLGMLDLERNGPQQARIRRQLVHLRPSLWLIVDHFFGNGKARTTWTSSHNVSLSEGEIAGSYHLRADDLSSKLTAFVLGSGDAQVKSMRGSLRPFAGWEIVGSTPQPAPALVIEQPAHDSWSVVIWSWDDGIIPSRQFERQPYMAVWNDAEHWKIALPIMLGPLEIQRAGNKISVGENTKPDRDKSLELTNAEDFTDKLEQVRNSYASAQAKYPKFRDNLTRWLKITKLLIILVILQEILRFIYRKTIKKHYLIIRLCNMIGWMAISLWLNMLRFAV